MRDFIWKVRTWLEQAYRWTRTFLEKILPHQNDTPEVRSLKLTVFLFVGIVGLMVVIGLLTFGIAVRGEEQTLVPNLRGKELVTALQDLQAKELYANVQVQFSAAAEKNVVLDQNPGPGTLVRAGKRISLKVSKGPVVDKVENFVGQKLDEVKSYLQTLFSSNTPNLIIKEPPIYQPSKSVPPGTIIAQNPKPGTRISGLTYLEFVVSQSGEESQIEVGDYSGSSFQEAITQLARENIPFVFSVQKADKNKQPGVVVSQSPAPKAKLPYGQLVQLVMTPPSGLGKDKVFGVFKYSLPDYPILVDIKLDVISDSGTGTILTMKHPGGPLSVPYIVPEGSEVVLSVLDKEEVREKAQPFGD
jgi:eukaryotic-like serine/threonine-protein kinase